MTYLTEVGRFDISAAVVTAGLLRSDLRTGLGEGAQPLQARYRAGCRPAHRLGRGNLGCQPRSAAIDLIAPTRYRGL